jgi:hypothetical protein
MKKSAADQARRDEQMANALEYAETVAHEADLRGVSGYDLFQSFVAVLAARNATLAGKLLYACSEAIRHHPVTKVLKPEPAEVDLVQQADGSYGPAN